jgi:hypothetical protein
MNEIKYHEILVIHLIQFRLRLITDEDDEVEVDDDEVDEMIVIHVKTYLIML